jgi:hypothetical protein
MPVNERSELPEHISQVSQDFAVSIVVAALVCVRHVQSLSKAICPDSQMELTESVIK